MAEILVEVRPRLGTRTTGELTTKSAKPEQLTNRIGELADALKELSIKIGDRLHELSGPQVQSGFSVDEIELKVNLDLESEAGVIIARAKASAGFEASIKWKKS